MLIHLIPVLIELVICPDSHLMNLDWIDKVQPFIPTKPKLSSPTIFITLI
jgi:hypothetical protein